LRKQLIVVVSETIADIIVCTSILYAPQ